MGKNIKKAIIILVILIILLSILILIYKKDNVEDSESMEKIDEESFDISIDENISKVITNDEFYNVENCVQYYIDYLNDENYEAIYRVLDENLIKSNNITIEDLEQSNTKLNGNNYIATKINKVEKSLDVSVYFVYGKLFNDEYTTIEEKNYTVIMDYSKSVFSIIPNSLEDNEAYEYNLNIEYDEEDYYNEFIYESLSGEDILMQYFNYYKNLASNNSSEAFLLLDEEYRDKRFNNSEEKYRKYLENIDIENIYPTKYMYNAYDEYNEYVCIDKNGIYYIFTEIGPMEIKLKLDTYTIASEKFINEYDEGNIEKKVMMNIDKWVSMLENKDYENAYNILDETFRNNNFENLEIFENYIKDNMPNNYSLEFKDQTYIGDNVYMQNVQLINDTENISKNIIIKIEENRNFVLSFEV